MGKKEIITLILAIIAAVYPICNTIYKVMYQNKCEEFYGVPGKYFNTSIDNRLIYLGCVILLLTVCILPVLIKKYDVKNENASKGYLMQTYFLAFVIGIEIGLFNVSNLIEIVEQTQKTNFLFDTINRWLNENAYFTVILIVILGIISILGVTLLKQIERIKYNWLKKAIDMVWCMSVLVSLMVMIYGTVFKLSISIEDKTKYEFQSIESSEYVVLATYHDKNVIVPFEVKEDKTYVFYTNQYMLVDVFSGKFQYIDIENSPFVCKEK